MNLIFFYFFCNFRVWVFLGGTAGKLKLGAYACGINTKWNLSIIWASLVLIEHFIKCSFASPHPPGILIWEFPAIPRISRAQGEGSVIHMMKGKHLEGEKNAKDKSLNTGKSMSRSVTESENKPLIQIFPHKRTLIAVTQLFRSPQ